MEATMEHPMGQVLVATADAPLAAATFRPLYGGEEGSLLSLRERQILSQIGEGRSNKEIAREFGSSPETIKSHVKHIFLKLDVNRRAQAVLHGQRLGLLTTG
jgi:DNA-binding CsgD family transcriptional regulator